MSFRAVVAQLVERVLGKDEVTSSILVNGSRVFLEFPSPRKRRAAEKGMKRVPLRVGVSAVKKGFLEILKWQRKNLIVPSRT